MSLYSDKVWRLFREPRRVGCFGPDEEGVVSGSATTPASHAQLVLHLKLAADGRIDDALFQALGCPSLIASGAWLCGWLLGRKADAVTNLEASGIVEQLELTPLKRYCAVMALDALNDALNKHSNSKTQGSLQSDLETVETDND